MIKQLIESVVGGFSDYYMELLQEISCKKVLKKGDFPLKQGEHCKYLWFIEEGAVKGYEEVDGINRIIYFYSDNNFFSNYFCWVTGNRSDITYQAVKPCKVIEIDYPKLEALCEQHHIFDTIGRKIAQKLFVREVELRRLLLNCNATDRYEYLEMNRPEIFNHFTLKDIASFMGVTDVSLSRIRAARSRVRN